MGVIHRDEFEQIRQDTEFNDICHDLEAAEEDQRELFDILDVDCSDSLDMEEVVEGIRLLRGEARRSDMASLHFLAQKVRLENQRNVDRIYSKLLDLQEMFSRFSLGIGHQ